MRSGDTRLRETTTMSGLWPTYIVSGSVVLWTSTSELRNFSRMPFVQVGDTRLRETTTMSGLWPTYIVSGSVVLWTSTSELRNFSRMPFVQV
ncbi:hypothetical protein V1477_012794 [Vespula maculifrons]|uniref:Uncharacterized protein n=1 Tax=Vespula maculifrons TaxID=7453 RepID=A0ABD2BUL9_VESMC